MILSEVLSASAKHLQIKLMFIQFVMPWFIKGLQRQFDFQEIWAKQRHIDNIRRYIWKIHFSSQYILRTRVPTETSETTFTFGRLVKIVSDKAYFFIKKVAHKDNNFYWLRGLDLNLRPSGYEPDELPSCSTPRY